MRSLRLFSLVLAFGFLSACGNLGPVASDPDPCDEDPSGEECEPPPGYIGSGD